MPDPSNSVVRVETDVITVGLVATPPDHPAEVVERLTSTLPALLAQADGAVRWEVEAGWGEVAPRRDGGVEALLDDVARRRDEAGWDVVVCLTDLPLQRQRVPLVAHSSARRRACVVSLPALGIGQLRGNQDHRSRTGSRVGGRRIREVVGRAVRFPCRAGGARPARGGRRRRRRGRVRGFPSGGWVTARRRDGAGQPADPSAGGVVQTHRRGFRHGGVRAGHELDLADGRRAGRAAPERHHDLGHRRAGGVADRRPRPVGVAVAAHTVRVGAPVQHRHGGHAGPGRRDLVPGAAGGADRGGGAADRHLGARTGSGTPGRRHRLPDAGGGSSARWQRWVGPSVRVSRTSRRSGRWPTATTRSRWGEHDERRDAGSDG